MSNRPDFLKDAVPPPGDTGGKKVKHVFLLGRSIGYSLSPAMHNAAFEALDLPYHYFPLSVEEEDLPRVMEALRALDFAGGNVTVPYKEKVMPLLDEMTREARECGSVNTILKRKGRLIGDSTDGRGFLRSCQWHNIELKGARILLLGAGGAGRAVGHAAAAGGAAAILLVDPAAEKAEALLDDLHGSYPHLDIRAVSPEEMTAEMVKERHLVVNASPVGAGDDQRLPLPPEFLEKDQVVYDLIYSPVNTGLMAAAQAAGARTFNGLAMLLFQGAASFLIWTGEAPPLQVMSDALCRGAGIDPWIFEGSGL